jgi:murein DD-endopeptidase MepM/ murein hydrolase activator NlpD
MKEPWKNQLPVFADPKAGTEITSGYGWRIHPDTGQLDYHGALDIAAPAGTSVQFHGDGVITLVRPNPKVGDKAENIGLWIQSGGITCQYFHVHPAEGLKEKEGKPFSGPLTLGTLYNWPGQPNRAHLHLACWATTNMGNLNDSTAINPLTGFPK